MNLTELNQTRGGTLRGDENGLITYFNFDYQPKLTGNQQLEDIIDRSVLRNSSEAFGVLVNDTERTRFDVTGQRLNSPINVDVLRTYGGLMFRYFSFDDGGNLVEDLLHQTREAQSQVEADQQPGVLFSASLVPGTGSVEFIDSDGALTIDADNDGLPDSWELQFGLDPGLNFGADGADGDPDQDGLPNILEYLLLVNTGTLFNPRNIDTDADGIIDGNEDNDQDGLFNSEESEIGALALEGRYR